MIGTKSTGSAIVHICTVIIMRYVLVHQVVAGKIYAIYGTGSSIPVIADRIVAYCATISTINGVDIRSRRISVFIDHAVLDQIIIAVEHYSVGPIVDRSDTYDSVALAQRVVFMDAIM